MNIYQKLIEVRKVVSYLKKEAKGQQFNYNPSSQVLMSVKEKLDEMNLLLIPAVTDKRLHQSAIEYLDKETGNPTKRTITYFTELDMTMTWVNGDNPEEKIEVPWYAQGVDIAGEKGVGKALTYAEKYFILKQFNIATNLDDPDSFQDKETTKEPTSKLKETPLSEAQIKRLFAIAKKHQITTEAVKRAIMDRYKKTQVADLTKAEYDEVISLMENREKEGA
jgi:hypothetical protein